MINKPNTCYCTREAKAILTVLSEEKREMTYIEILSRTQVNTLIAVSAIAWLLRREEIIYRMEDDVQYFRINEKAHESQPLPDRYRPREVDIYLRFRQLVKEHVREHFTVASYASLLAITPKYLTSVVRQVSGESAHKWIERETMLSIKEALSNTQLSIKQVAWMYNFPTTSFFARFFKRLEGCTPSEFRKLIISEK